MTEYRIIRQNNNAKPFSLWTFDNFEACLCKLQDMINDTGNCFCKDYYVFNSFYENHYNTNAKVKFKVECRQVGDWYTYSDEENKIYNKKTTKIY